MTPFVGYLLEAKLVVAALLGLSAISLLAAVLQLIRLTRMLPMILLLLLELLTIGVGGLYILRLVTRQLQ